MVLMNRFVRISIILAAFLCAGTLPAQTSRTSTQNTIERAAPAITPEDILGIRDIRELQLSPDGKQIAFVVKEPADPKLPRQPRSSNIWVVPSNGSERPRPLVPGLKNGHSPFWSPDGRTLAFLSDRGADVNDSAEQGDQVYLFRVAGGDRAKVERLTSAPGGVEGFEWSPNGKMIAFIAREQPTASDRARAR